MYELASRPLLRREELAEGNYFESLLEKALEGGLIERGFAEGVQVGCMGLLAEACRRYTGGQSTSLPQEQAEDILRSILFTMGLWLKGYPEPVQALQALSGGMPALKEGLKTGLSRAKTKIQATRQFYRMAQRRMLDTDNYVYNSTFMGGIQGFFKLYEPRFGAHKIHITADYPVLLFPGGYQGIEFIQRYVQALDYENRFCRAFPPSACKAAVTLYAIEYDTAVENLHGNLCGAVLQAALACALTDCPAAGLALSPAAQSRLGRILSGGSLEEHLPSALEAVLQGIAVSPGTADYLRKAVQAHGLGMAEEMKLLV